MNASGWWIVVGIVAVAGPLLVHWTMRPWTRCHTCDGKGTLRDVRSGKFTGHCKACRGYGWIERPARQDLRHATGGRLFPTVPSRPYDGQMFGGQVPWGHGGRRGRRPRRRRTRARR